MERKELRDVEEEEGEKEEEEWVEGRGVNEGKENREEGKRGINT